jgi:hypothetical protein
MSASALEWALVLLVFAGVAGYAIAWMIVDLADRLGLVYNPNRERPPKVRRASEAAHRHTAGWR